LWLVYVFTSLSHWRNNTLVCHIFGGSSACGIFFVTVWDHTSMASDRGALSSDRPVPPVVRSLEMLTESSQFLESG
jgi:hypothetical protein